MRVRPSAPNGAKGKLITASPSQFTSLTRIRRGVPMRFAAGANLSVCVLHLYNLATGSRRNRISGRLRSRRGLVEPRVAAAAANQVIVRSYFDDLSAFQNDDPIGHPDRGKSV